MVPDSVAVFSDRTDYGFVQFVPYGFGRTMVLFFLTIIPPEHQYQRTLITNMPSMQKPQSRHSTPLHLSKNQNQPETSGPVGPPRLGS